MAREESVEFVIGMRWQDLWRLAARPWVPLAFARMLIPADDGAAATRVGLRWAGPVVVQRWSTQAAVDAWARSNSGGHAGAWSRFRLEEGRIAAWGVWHEIRRAEA